MTDDATYRIIDLDDDTIADIAAKFKVNPDTVRQEWETAKSLGPDKVRADLDYYLAEVDQAIDQDADDAVGWFGPDRTRALADYYQAALEGIDTDEAEVGDLVMKLSITIFKLAEAKEQIAALLDGQRRTGGG